MERWPLVHKDFQSFGNVLKSKDWKGCYILSDDSYFYGTKVLAEENEYYISDGNDDPRKVAKEEYDQYHTSLIEPEHSSVCTFTELTSLLRYLNHLDDNEWAFDFPKWKVFVLDCGDVNAERENEDYTWLYSFKVLKVLSAPEFLQYFSNTLLEEYKSFGLVTKCSRNKDAVDFASDGFHY